MRREHPLLLRIVKETDVYLAMEEAEKLANEIGFDSVSSIKIKTAVSELGRNILKYAVQGRVEMSYLDKPKKGIKIQFVDNGPGIKDVNSALKDNYSSGGTLGLGLPGVRRMMDEFEIESQLNKGTSIVISKWLS